MNAWKKSLKEKELFLKNFRTEYWEKFGSLPTISELTRASWHQYNAKQEGMLC